MSNFKAISIYLIIAQFIFIVNCNRKISFTLNPNCTKEVMECDKPWIMYGKGDNQNNTIIHYLWSAFKIPSFIMVLTHSNSEIIIDWENLSTFTAKSIKFSEGYINMFGFSFQNLILFNDKDNTGTLENITDDNKLNLPLSNFDWIINQEKPISDEEFLAEFSTVSYKDELLKNDSKISISVTSYGFNGRSTNLPHLITSQDSSYFEVILDNLSVGLSETHFCYPRYALDAIILNDNYLNEANSHTFTYQCTHSLDDEHAPGVFELAEISTPCSSQAAASPFTGGYLQWRPVAYLTTSKTITAATYPNVNSFLPSHLDEAHFLASKNSLMYSLVGSEVRDLSTQTTIAFGLQGDGFYLKHNYTIWSFTLGVGEFPKESFSRVLIIVIVVGVGLPLVFLLFGFIFIGIKKYRQRDQPLLKADE